MRLVSATLRGEMLLKCHFLSWVGNQISRQDLEGRCQLFHTYASKHIHFYMSLRYFFPPFNAFIPLMNSNALMDLFFLA